MRDARPGRRMSPASTISLLVALGALAALLSALEATITSLRAHQLEILGTAPERARVRRAARLVRRRPQTVLLAVLLASALINLSLVALAVYLVLEHAPTAGFRHLPAALVVFSLLVVATDAIPKSLALAHPKDTLRKIAPVLNALWRAFARVAKALVALTDTLIDRLSPSPLKSRGLLTADELETWIEMRRDMGTLDHGESAIIQEIIRLGSKTAKDFITPRVDTFTIDLSTPPDIARRLVHSQPHWRIPVYRDDPDAITGVLDVKRYLLAGTGATIADHIDPPVFVPETMKATDLLKERLHRPNTLAVVLDEYGGFEGIVTHADFLEEIIEDAAPLPDQTPEIQPLGHGRYLVSGAARLDDLSAELDTNLEEDGLDTIGGLVFTTAGQLPEPGAPVRLSGGITATVRRVARNRIAELLLTADDDE